MTPQDIKAKIELEIRRHRDLQTNAKAEADAASEDSGERAGHRAVMRLHEGAVYALEALLRWIEWQ